MSWFVSDPKFDICTYFFSKKDPDLLFEKLSELEDSLLEYLGEHEAEDYIGDGHSRSGAVAKEETDYLPSEITDLVQEVQPNLLTDYPTLLAFGQPNHDFEAAPFQVTIYRLVLGLDPQGVLVDGESVCPAHKFLEKLKTYKFFDVFGEDPERSYFEDQGVGEAERPSPPATASLSATLLGGWDLAKEHPFKRTLFRQSILSASADIIRAFDALVKNPRLDDDSLRQKLEMTVGDFGALKAKAAHLVQQILEDTSES